MKIDRQVYEVANRLRSPEFEPFVSYIRTERAELLELMSQAPSANVQLLQGKAQQMKQILDLIDDAHKVLEKKEGLLARMFKP